MFELGVCYSFPVRHHAKLTWEFPTSPHELEDSTLLIGLSPPPDVRPVEMFLLRTVGLPRLAKTYRPEIEGSYFAKRGRVTWSRAAERIQRFLYSGRRAEAIMCEAMSGLNYVNTAALARAIGWPELRAYEVYARMKERGIEVPPVLWRVQRHIQWSCDACGLTRSMTIRDASLKRTGLCKTCYDAQRRIEHRFVFKCRQCGNDRHLAMPPHRKDYRFSEPEDALCRSCGAKQNVVRALRESSRRSRLLRKAYRTIGVQIVNALRRKFDPRIEDVDGVPRLISFTQTDGTRRFARIKIRDIDLAARIISGSRRIQHRLARLVAKAAPTWHLTRKWNVTSICIDDLLR